MLVSFLVIVLRCVAIVLLVHATFGYVAMLLFLVLVLWLLLLLELYVNIVVFLQLGYRHINLLSLSLVGRFYVQILRL